jgi:hypothetical protein
MAKERTPDRRDGLAEPPIDVQITVVPRRDGSALGDRIRDASVSKRARALVVLALVVAAGVAIAAAALPGHRGAAPPLAATPAPVGGPAGVAAMYGYGYPFRCLTVTVDATDPAFARADFDQGSYCSRFSGWVTAVFHRVRGGWRMVVDAGEYWCPAGAIPRAVQLQLGICGRTGRRARPAN